MDIALKVDVDTHDGAKHGIPRLAALFDELGIRASFFVTMGPDHSGRAILRVFTRRGFLSKMLRTRAAATYGWRTVLSGTLLPARPVGHAFPGLLRALRDAGHDVGPHGWDHVRWHDRLRRMDAAAARREFARGFDALSAILGAPPEGAAAPGWQCTPHSLAAQDALGIRWHSDTRGAFPFVPCADGREYAGLEIPTTLPTLDEVLGTPEVERGGPVAFFANLVRPERLNVFTLHTETEGAQYLGFLRELLLRWRGQGARFVRLSDVALGLAAQREALPRAEISWGELPGRAGAVACQGAPFAASACAAAPPRER